jgi:hypothetical protein
MIQRLVNVPPGRIIKRCQAGAGLDHIRIVDVLSDPRAGQSPISIEGAFFDQNRKPFGVWGQFGQHLISVAVTKQSHAFPNSIVCDRCWGLRQDTLQVAHAAMRWDLRRTDATRARCNTARSGRRR